MAGRAAKWRAAAAAASKKVSRDERRANLNSTSSSIRLRRLIFIIPTPLVLSLDEPALLGAPEHCAHLSIGSTRETPGNQPQEQRENEPPSSNANEQSNDAAAAADGRRNEDGGHCCECSLRLDEALVEALATIAGRLLEAGKQLITSVRVRRLQRRRCSRRTIELGRLNGRPLNAVDVVVALSCAPLVRAIRAANTMRSACVHASVRIRPSGRFGAIVNCGATR